MTTRPLLALLPALALIAGCANLPPVSEYDGSYEVTAHTTDDGTGAVDVDEPYAFFKIEGALYGFNAEPVTAFYPCDSASSCNEAYESNLSLSEDDGGWLDVIGTTSLNGECSVSMMRVVYESTSGGLQVRLEEVGGPTTELEGCEIDNMTDELRDSLPVVETETIEGDSV